MNADANHNRAVDFNDLIVLGQNYNTSGKSFAQGDFNGDGIVNFDDNLILAQHYNTRLSAAPTYAGEVTVDSLPEQWDGSTPLRVNWAPIDDADLQSADPANAGLQIAGYDVYRSTDSVDFSKVGTVERDLWSDDPQPAVYSYVDGTASDAVKYWYRIRPFYETTKVDAATGDEITTTHRLATTNKAWRAAAIKAPEDVTLHGSAGATIDWTDASTGETGYKVEMRIVGGTWTTVATTAANVQTLNVSATTVAALGTNGLVSSYEARVTALSSTTQMESAPINATGDANVIDPTSIVPQGVAVYWRNSHTIGPGETNTIHLDFGTGLAGHYMSVLGANHASYTTPSFQLDGEGTYDLQIAGITPGADKTYLKDITANVLHPMPIDVAGNDVGVISGVTLIEDETAVKTFKIIRAPGASPTAQIVVDLSLAQYYVGFDADASDVTVDAQATLPSGVNEVLVNVRVNNNDTEAEGVEQIRVNAQPHGGKAIRGAIAGTIDDDASVNSFDIKVGDWVNASNGCSFGVNINIDGEHVDQLEIRQTINSSTSLTSYDGHNLSRTETLAELSPPEVVDSNNTFVTDTDWDWGDINSGPSKFNGKALHIDSQLVNVPGGEWVALNNSTTQVRVNWLMGISRYFHLETRNKITHAPLKGEAWGYKWDNFNCFWSQANGAPEISCVGSHLGVGVFSDVQTIKGLP